MITHDINVMIGKDNPDKNIVVKRNDTGVNFNIHLKTAKRLSSWRKEETDYIIPRNVVAVLKISKPDKTYVLIDGTTSAASVLYKTPKKSKAITVPGISKAEVSIYDEDGRRITSATFNIEVADECVSGHEEDSGNYVDLMGELIEEIQKAASSTESSAENAADSATDAEKAAEDAKKSKENAAKSAKIAADAQVNVPFIGENGNWYVWSVENSEYVNSGVKAQGPQGKDGESGLPTIIQSTAASWSGVLMPYSEMKFSEPMEYLSIYGFTPNAKNPGNDMWSIVFTAADSMEFWYLNSIEWSIAEPVITKGYTYYMSFIPLRDDGVDGDGCFVGKILGVWVAKELTASE